MKKYDFKIADSHREYLEDQVNEWLKMGTIKPTLSRTTAQRSW